MRDLKIVFVGHVDHGKSTLIGRLLHDTGSLSRQKVDEIKQVSEELGREFEYGFILDHLQEEREQAVTIETTQIFFKTAKRDYVIIDAPGHVEFIKNMITGASQAEAAIMIVDANEGVQEQTKRHAYILSLLGIKQVVVVINKMDIVEYSQDKFDAVKKDVEKFLEGLKIKPEFVIPISAKNGDNVVKSSQKMDWHKGKHLLDALDVLENMKDNDEKPLRFPVQDVYMIDSKRIYVGRVESGVLKRGDPVMLLPSGKKSTIKTIEKFNEEPSEASSGECIGITLTNPWFLERGEVICREADSPKVVDTLNANVFWMSPQKFSKGDSLSIKCMTQEVACRIENIHRKIDSSSLEVLEEDASELGETEVGELTLKTEKPICIDDFNDISESGRFVFEKDMDTVAGGIILGV